MNKYRNKKIIVDDYIFDSIQESRRYKELKLLLRAGQIQDLELQPHFLLQESFKKNGKTYRKIEYIADFKYIEKKSLKNSLQYAFLHILLQFITKLSYRQNRLQIGIYAHC